MPLGYKPSEAAISAVTYAVTTTGDAMFQSTIASSDSPDYTTAKAEANTQCVKLSPKAQEVVS